MQKMKNWYNRKELNTEDILSLSGKYGVIPPVAAVLLKRGITDVEGFLNPEKGSLPAGIFKDMEKGTAIIKDFIERGEKICVINDYDADGITSGTIMRDVIAFLGGSVICLTPDRVIDGYGISERLINVAHKNKCGLIVTTDNGISAVSQTSFAKEKGIKVVVTDHHEVPFTLNNGEKEYILPDADAVINPKQKDCPFPFKEICGAVVAYYVAASLLDLFNVPASEKKAELDRYMELACIGTVCDVMPLTDVNRVIVAKGLKLLGASGYVGLRQLIKQLSINPETITAEDLGYFVGPCLNSVSRMNGNVELSMKLLAEKDHVKAESIASEIKSLNEKRKKLCKEESDRAVEIMETSGKVFSNFITVYIPHSYPSLMGIIASELVEKYGLPVICLTDDDTEGLLKGSGRSVEGVNLFELLTEEKGLLAKFGGHSQAAGLSVSKDNVGRLAENLDQKTKVPDCDVKSTAVDLFMPLANVTEEVVKGFYSFGPFGEGNEHICFAALNVNVKRITRIGQNKNFLRISFEENGRTIDTVYFGDLGEFEGFIKSKYNEETLSLLYRGVSAGVPVDIIYVPYINFWNGRETLGYKITDYK